MVKFNLDQRLDAVNKYLSGKYGGYKALGNVLGIDPTDLRDWVGRYEFHGIDGLVPRYGSVYSEEFKVEVVNFLKKNSLSFWEAASYFNLPSRKTVKRWYEKVENGTLKIDYSSLRSSPDMKKTETNESPTEELQRLRTENAYLKKLISLSQKTAQRKQKSKLERLLNSRENLD